MAFLRNMRAKLQHAQLVLVSIEIDNRDRQANYLTGFPINI